jgi:hypothetical protein
MLVRGSVHTKVGDKVEPMSALTLDGVNGK